MELLPQVLVDGLTVGGTYALAAIGISLIFGVLNVINFGHGAAYGVAAFVAMWLMRGLGFGLVPAFVGGTAAAFCVGFVVERITVRPLREAPLLMPLITTLGIGMVIENGLQFVFGPQTRSFPAPPMGAPFVLGDMTVSPWEALTLLVAVVVIAALHLWLRYTNFGTAVRAIAEDRRAASLLGINVDRTISVVFCIASALGGLAGILSAALYNAITPLMGSASMLKAFAASVLGGMEQAGGAVVGGLFIGIAEAFTSVYIGTSWSNLVSLLLLVLVLLFWPSGLLGRRHLDKIERSNLNILPLPPVPTWRDPGLPLCALALALLPLAISDPYYLRIMTVMLLYGTLALSLNLVAGFAGIISLAQAAFYGIGAYASALFATRFGLPVWACFLGATAFTGAFGVAFAWPVMRLRGHYVAMGTLGLAGVVWMLMVNWIDLTHGPMGIRAIPSPDWFDGPLSGRGFYYLMLVILAVATLTVVMLLDSAYGRSLRAMRDDELGAASVGVDARTMKMLAFGVSAAIAGACGSFWAHYVSFISPDSFTPMESIAILSMVVLGGIGSVPGAILGGAVLAGLPEILRFAADYRQAVYGLVMMLVVLYRPQGLLGFSGTGRRWLTWRRLARVMESSS
jgi:branched-chain amino acid transport system permease protein